jgi:hypothetical protein
VSAIRYYTGEMRTCHACKKEISADLKVGRKDECPHCRSDLRCCLNCTFHDPRVAKQCRETIAELVKDKSKANFCDHFAFAEGRAGFNADRGEQTRKALDDLFRK